MLQLFTVRWPLLARLDAVLFFPVALLLAGQTAPVRKFVDHTVGPLLPSVIFRLGISAEATFWAEMVLIGIIPFVLLLVVADRLLSVRKGFALLSVASISAAAAAATQLSPRLAFLPARVESQLAFLSLGQQAALLAGGVAFLLHARPLWIGLRDQGEVATRLVHGHGPLSPTSWERRENDIYVRRMAEFRNWNGRERLDGGVRVPSREGSGMKFMHVLAWTSIGLGLGFAYLHWSSWGAGGHEMSVPGLQSVQPSVQTGHPEVKPILHPSAVPVVTGSATPPPAPAPAERPVAVAALPSVQRPTEMVLGLENGDPSSGPNEAIARRGRDGSFAFDAVVNGAHVQMLFDTGASVVALRAEDAERFGIGLGNLNYSAKVKTANGTAEVAPVIIDTLTIGNITQRHVVGYVAREGVLPRNLLGQTFLARLAGYNVENDQLVLKGQ